MERCQGNHKGGIGWLSPGISTNLCLTEVPPPSLTVVCKQRSRGPANRTSQHNKQAGQHSRSTQQTNRSIGECVKEQNIAGTLVYLAGLAWQFVRTIVRTLCHWLTGLYWLTVHKRSQSIPSVSLAHDTMDDQVKMDHVTLSHGDHWWQIGWWW